VIFSSFFSYAMYVVKRDGTGAGADASGGGGEDTGCARSKRDPDPDDEVGIGDEDAGGADGVLNKPRMSSTVDCCDLGGGLAVSVGPSEPKILDSNSCASCPPPATGEFTVPDDNKSSFPRRLTSVDPTGLFSTTGGTMYQTC